MYVLDLQDWNCLGCYGGYGRSILSPLFPTFSFIKQKEKEKGKHGSIISEDLSQGPVQLNFFTKELHLYAKLNFPIENQKHSFENWENFHVLLCSRLPYKAKIISSQQYKQLRT